MRRVISLWLPHWPTDRATRGRLASAPPLALSNPSGAPASGTAERPLVAVATVGNRALVTAANMAAEAAGIAPGLSLADARAREPGLSAIAADPTADAASLAELAEWCRRYTPVVGVDGADGIWLDITGCAHLFGGEAALVADLANRLARFGLDLRLGLADTAGAAWAAARYGRSTIVEHGDARAALAPLPVAGLRLLPEAVETLQRLGLRSIGDLYTLPRAPLAARFGGGHAGRALAAGVVGRLDQALGRASETIAALRPVPAFIERTVLAEPIMTAEAIAAAVRRLIGRLMRALERAQAGARRIELEIYRVDGAARRLAIGTSRPARDADALFRLFAEKLELIDPGFGIDALVLAAPVVEKLGAAQLAIDAADRGSGADQAADAAAPLIDRLANRLGTDAVFGFDAVESHVPERGQCRMPAIAARPTGGTRPNARSRASFGRRRDRPAPRPLRLFARPEPVEVIAGVPDHPPAQFRWRGRGYRIARAEGPERIAPEWWRGAAAKTDADMAALTPGPMGAARDYYRVEDEAGRRFWLFRAGLYGAADEPCWFLHGLFG